MTEPGSPSTRVVAYVGPFPYETSTGRTASSEFRCGPATNVLPGSDEPDRFIVARHVYDTGEGRGEAFLTRHDARQLRDALTAHLGDPTDLDALRSWLIERIGTVEGDASGHRGIAETSRRHADTAADLDHARSAEFHATLADVRAGVLRAVLARVTGSTT